MATDWHHLMRVRVGLRMWATLQDIAARESQRSGERVTASDLVRHAILEWMRNQEATTTAANSESKAS